MATQDEVATLSRTTLEAFVIRSRRVDAHSLMSDLDAVIAMSQGQITLRHIHPTGEQFLVQNLPAEEVVESAAARLRPLILKDDPVYWGKALKAIGYFLRDSDDQAAKDSLAFVKQSWQKRAEPKAGIARGYFLQMQRGDDSPTSSIVDSDLGMSWFYGDVVHADAKHRAAGADFGITERYRAAVMLIANGLLCNHLTLDFIQNLRNAGLLELADQVFTEEVVVTETHLEMPANFYAGNEGAELPKDLTGALPAGFERFDADKHVPTHGASKDEGPR